jgi:hypothetical protein
LNIKGEVQWRKEKIELHRQSWDRCVSAIEHDVHGAQTRAYKIMKNLNKTEKDTAQFNNISKDTWLSCYKHLRTNSQELELEYNENEIPCLDPITWTELDEILKTMKNRKTPGCVTT